MKTYCHRCSFSEQVGDYYNANIYHVSARLDNNLSTFLHIDKNVITVSINQFYSNSSSLISSCSR